MSEVSGSDGFIYKSIERGKWEAASIMGRKSSDGCQSSAMADQRFRGKKTKGVKKMKVTRMLRFLLYFNPCRRRKMVGDLRFCEILEGG